jgi:hypothetical protein
LPRCEEAVEGFHGLILSVDPVSSMPAVDGPIDEPLRREIPAQGGSGWSPRLGRWRRPASVSN